MNSILINALRWLCLTPLAVLCLASTGAAQDTMPVDAATNPLLAVPADTEAPKAQVAIDDPGKTPPTGDTDKAFAMKMKTHHQRGVEMAQLELVNGKSQAVRGMARQIIAVQKREIAQFDHWLSQNR